MIFSLLILAAAQSDRLPPAQPLPPPTTTEGAVMAPIATLLRALERHDGPALLAQTVADGTITAVRTGPDGRPQRRTQRWTEFAAGLKADGTRMEERLGQPAIEIDDSVAMVWVPYTFVIDGKLSHCGYDHFDLVREGDGWKVLNITYSARKTGCKLP